MGFIIAVKERQNNTDNMFDPLKQTIELLKSYDHEMSEDVYQLLADLPEKATKGLNFLAFTLYWKCIPFEDVPIHGALYGRDLMVALW